MTQEIDQWLKDLLSANDEQDVKMTEKQARIIEAAIEIFSEKGYAATSTSEIASKAGVAEGTIFRHYKTKKDLLLAITGPIMAKLIAPFFMRDFVKVLDIPYDRMEDVYRAIISDRIAFARQNTKLIKILAHEVPFHPELQEHIKPLLTQQVINRMERIIRHFQAKGEIIEAPPWRIIRTSISVVLGLIITHIFFMPDFPFDEEEEINWLIDFLMHGLAARS